MLITDQIANRARTAARTIVLSEGEDSRICRAAVSATRQGIANIVLLGRRERILSAAETSVPLTVIDPRNDKRLEHYAQVLAGLRKHKAMTIEQSREAVKNELVFGALMVQQGEADGCLAGAVNKTSDVLRSALQVIGVAPQSKLVSSFMIMEHNLPHQTIQGTAVYADCAMNIEPDAGELADIAMTTARSCTNLLGMEPKVALLSFSTAGSACHPHVDKIRKAGEIIALIQPDLQLIPEVQFDAAILPEVLKRKAPNMPVPAPANVFVFPDLQSANIAYKIAERIGGVIATGPILQGLRRPVNDLSRGCRVDDIVRLIAVTVVQAQTN